MRPALSVLILLVGLGLGILLVSPPVHAVNTTTFTWGIPVAGYHELQLTAERCMAATGAQNLRVAVFVRPGQTVSTGATLTGTIYKPGGGTDAVTFAGQGDGNYTHTYSFAQPGTYKLVLHSTETNYGSGDLNEYVYVQDFNFGIAFLNNSFSLAPGETGTIQNYVTNSDQNAVTGITGRIDITDPLGNPFVTNGTISETGNGNYYFSFTAPSTEGLYTATSRFTCGSHTDSNSQGRFTVSNPPPSSGGGSSGSSGGSIGGGGGGGSAGAPRKRFNAAISDWNFETPIEVGIANHVHVTLTNTGVQGTAFLVKATISQAQEKEYFDTQLTPLVNPGKSVALTFGEEYTAFSSGNHVLNIQVYMPDGGEKIAEFAQAFDVGGVLRYDVVATCLDKSVVPGNEVTALINLINQGDYFQDMQFSWWVEGEDQKPIGMGTFPIALYNQESRSLVRGVTLPIDTAPGSYLFRVQLSYRSTQIEGSCSFLVQKSKDYYTDQLHYSGTVLAQIESIVNENPEKAIPEVLEQITELKLLLAIFEADIQTEDYAQARIHHDEIRAKLDNLSRMVIDQKTGLLDNVNVPQVAVTVVAVVLTAGGMLAIQAGNARAVAELSSRILLDHASPHPGKASPAEPVKPEHVKSLTRKELTALQHVRPASPKTDPFTGSHSMLGHVLGLKPPKV